MAKPEGEIERYLRLQAESYGYLCMKFVSPGNNGVPDRIVIGHNETFFVETKAPGETTRRLQDSVIADIRAHGAKVYILDTKEKIDQLFSEKQSKLGIRKKPPAETAKKTKGCRLTASILTTGKATSLA